MPLQGVDVVARLSQGRNLDLRHAKKLGPNDWLTYLEPVPKPDFVDNSPWKWGGEPHKRAGFQRRAVKTLVIFPPGAPFLPCLLRQTRLAPAK